MPGSFSSLNIRELVAVISSGNIDAFEQFFLRYKNLVYSVAYKMTRSEEIAEDLSQNFFLNFWINRSKLEGVSYPGAYIHRMICNLAKDTLRRKILEQAHYRLSQLDAPAYANPVEESMEMKDLEKLLAEATANLPQVTALVFQMRNQEQLSYEEIAKTLNITLKTARTYFHDAVKYIRTYIRTAELNDGTLLPVFFLLSCALKQVGSL